MGESCIKVTIFVMNCIIAAICLADLIGNIVINIYIYTIVADSIIIVGMVVGIIGACIRFRSLLIISSILCCIYTILLLTALIVGWVLYAECMRNNNTQYECSLNFCIWATTGIIIAIALLVVSGTCTHKLQRMLQLEQNGGISVTLMEQRITA